jgi:hypothetical protein
MMPLWYFYGKQNVPTETYRTTPADYGAKVNAFVEQYTVGKDEAVDSRSLRLLPVAMCISAPAPGSGIRSCNWKRERIPPAYLFHGFAARVLSSAGQYQSSGYSLDMTMLQPLHPPARVNSPSFAMNTALSAITQWLVK